MRKFICILCTTNLLSISLLAQRRVQPYTKSYETDKAAIVLSTTYIHFSSSDSIPLKDKELRRFIFRSEITGDHFQLNFYPKTSGERLSIFPTSMPIDTIHTDLDLTYSQIRVIRNGNIEKNWIGIRALKRSSDSMVWRSRYISSYGQGMVKVNNADSSYVSGFQILNTSINIQDEIFVDIRNKKTNSIQATFKIERIKRLYTPFLAMMCHDSNSTGHIPKLFINYLMNKDSIYESINTFYKDWYWNNEHLFPSRRYFTSSKMLFIFRKYDNSVVDSSLEYQLVTGDNNTIYWRKTGHMLLVDALEDDKSYHLRVRYSEHPENIFSLNFYTDPKWYRTPNFRLKIIGIILLIIMASAFFIYRQNIRKLNEKKTRLALQIKSIRSQLNPHFIFNALTSIQALINKKEIDKANKYLSEFSDLLRDTLKGDNSDFVPLSSELKVLESYMKLEQLRFNFHYQVKIDENINLNAVEIPSLLLQPLLENAVKHGIAELSLTGYITVTIFTEMANLLLSISDNGNGFNDISIQNGYGLKLTKDRISLLNQTLKGQSIKMRIESGKEYGTHVHLVFENWLDT